MQTGASIYPLLLAFALAISLTFPPAIALWSPVGAALLALGALAWGAIKPYGLEGHILAQSRPISLPFTPDRLYVAEETAVYARKLRNVARIEDLENDTQIVDLSAGGPGSALLLNGQAPYYPWLLPGTRKPGGIGLRAWELLSPEQKQNAWIIGPIRPEYKALATSILNARPGCYRHYSGLEKYFWGSRKPVELWVPRQSCRTGAKT
jgi:hypothetical protein